METKAKIDGLVGKDLADFKIVVMTEVYRVNDDGRKTISLGFFKDSNIAGAFAGVQVDAIWCRTEHALVLTDGVVGYVVGQSEPVKLFNDEARAIEIRKKAIAKLSPQERVLLGFADQ